ncbi:MAG: diaminopropionate ammonia-lyase [Anaerovoracaceae bacterium]|jgi:diaminopropionate ammonia-lyase
MEERIQCLRCRHTAAGAGEQPAAERIADFGAKAAAKVNAFHRSFPGYRPTPLLHLKNLAAELGVRDICVKDESTRFGLNAFKVLGGSYALGMYMAERLHKDISELPFDVLTGDETRRRIGDLTFVTATDGNHGRGVAWTAAQLRQNCVVYMPAGSSPERLANIRAQGAEASITDLNYDGAVRLAAAQAEKNGWVLVQDTAWDGNEQIPRWIMQGYTSMVHEMAEQLGSVKPTHVFLQAGVGAMAGAVTACLCDRYRGAEKPIVVIVEPEAADCFYRTAKAADGQRHFVTGEMSTIMAGLACGEPCTIGWDILREEADYFVSMPDRVAAVGMRVLSGSIGDDPRVISGESGAAGFGLAVTALRGANAGRLREQLELNKNSVILCISTEGATDRENWRRIVWDGAYAADRVTED